MFIVLITYKKPLAEIDRLLDQHIEFLEKGYKEQLFIFSGRRDPRVGGLILVNLEGEDKVKQIMDEDPFFIHDVADYSYIKFTPTKYDERFSCFIG